MPDPTTIVIVELPEPGDAIGFGLKVMVVPLGVPLAERDMEELKPFSPSVVIVDVP